MTQENLPSRRSKRNRLFQTDPKPLGSDQDVQDLLTPDNKGEERSDALPLDEEMVLRYKLSDETGNVYDKKHGNWIGRKWAEKVDLSTMMPKSEIPTMEQLVKMGEKRARELVEGAQDRRDKNRDNADRRLAEALDEQPDTTSVREEAPASENLMRKAQKAAEGADWAQAQFWATAARFNQEKEFMAEIDRIDAKADSLAGVESTGERARRLRSTPNHDVLLATVRRLRSDILFQVIQAREDGQDPSPSDWAEYWFNLNVDDTTKGTLKELIRLVTP